ncbi:MAG TPA: hypothetical protein GX739_00170 [Firmicutes bacterium]|nr:hypothetical protein [Bacillota bacterium]
MRWQKQYLKYAAVGVLLISLVTIYWINQGQKKVDEVPEQQKKPRLTVKDNEMDLLARAVHAEAKGEPYEGKVAVAAVILNRVEHPEFPNTIAGVIYEPLAFQVVANGTINQEPDQVSRQAAYDALHGLDPTNGALYFYNPAKTQNRWIRSRPVLKTIGKHIFAG